MSSRAVAWAMGLDIPPAPKLVLTAIADGANADGWSWPSDGQLETSTSMRDDEIAGHVDDLLAAGLLRPHRRRYQCLLCMTGPQVGVWADAWVPAFPGDVAPGFVRWGAAIGGNSDPARHEDVTIKPLGLRRTYHGWEHRTGRIVDTARDDLAAGRLPWVSTKTPDWSAMADGIHDDEIDEMLRALDALDGPSWLTVWHEPENDNRVASEWRDMQIRVRQRMRALATTNIAFAPILMSWTFDARSGRDPADWWVDDIWDFAGIDHYVEHPDDPLGTAGDEMWTAAHKFYSDKGIKVALGEWANRGEDVAAADDMDVFYRRGVQSGATPGSQIIGFAYFDSGLNSPKGSYVLQGKPLATFRELIDAPTSLTAGEDGS